jgi:LysM repeat protein
VFAVLVKDTIVMFQRKLIPLWMIFLSGIVFSLVFALRSGMKQIGQDIFQLQGELKILQEKTRLWEQEGKKKPLPLHLSSSEKANEYTIASDYETIVGDRVQETVHIIRKGENLFRIGLKYGMPWETLTSYNNLSYPGQIYVGQILKIPLFGDKKKTLASNRESGHMSQIGNIQGNTN